MTDIYTEFIDDNFDAKEYANTVIESHIIGDALAKLSTGIDLLNKELQTQVTFFSLKLSSRYLDRSGKSLSNFMLLRNSTS